MYQLTKLCLKGYQYLAPFPLRSKAATEFDSLTRLWIGIASLTRKAQESLFSSQERTSKIIKDGSYIGLLYMLLPELEKWKRDFEATDCEFRYSFSMNGELTIKEVSQPMQVILTIEFGYLQAYMNSIALQAVVEQRLSQNFVLHRGNDDFIDEVVRGARMILQAVVDVLLPLDQLKYLPVRTYFRILAAVLYLLKVSVTDPNVMSFVPTGLSRELSEKICPELTDAFRPLVVQTRLKRLKYPCTWLTVRDTLYVHQSLTMPT